MDEQLLPGALWCSGGYLCDCERDVVDPWSLGTLESSLFLTGVIHFLKLPVATLQTFIPLSIAIVTLCTS